MTDWTGEVFDALAREDLELEDWQERLLRMRYGVPQSSLRQVAEVFGVSLVQARQLEALALRAAGL